MSDLKIRKARVREAAEECPDAETVLKKLFPEAFAEDYEWRDISGEVGVKKEGGGGGFFVQIYWKGDHIGFISGGEIRDTAITFLLYPEGYFRKYEFRASYHTDVFKIEVRKR